MFRMGPWYSYVGFMCAFGLLAIATWPASVVVGQLFAALCGLSLLGMVLNLNWKRRDPYSLQALRELEEREELSQIDVPDAGDAAGVMCSCCKEFYSRHYPMCPRCAKVRKRY